MVNLVISQFKDTIKHFYKSAQAIRQEQEFNKGRYSSDVARELNNELISKLNAETEKSKSLISEIYSETIKKLSVLSAPNSAELDSNDYWLLTDTNFVPNQRDFEIIIARKVKILQQILGHSNINITFDVYTELDMQCLQTAFEETNEYMKLA